MYSFSSILNLVDTTNLHKVIDDVEIEKEQLGKNVEFLNNTNSDKNVDYHIAILGVSVLFGSELEVKYGGIKNDINEIRRKLYFLYCWHSEVKIIDFGNIVIPRSIEEAYETIGIITNLCNIRNIKLIVLGGPHNLLLGQFNGLKKTIGEVNLSNIDALIDINNNKRFQEYLFLDFLFSNKKSGLKHYNHIGFQSYYTHPKILDILNIFKYDFYRLGFVKDNMFEIEPQIRDSDLISFDLNAIKDNKSIKIENPNGFNGEESCLLMRFCGMSNRIKALGLYGYYSFLDKDKKIAELSAQMIWYFIEGFHHKMLEGDFEDTNLYNTFFTTMNDIKTIFYQNKHTKRWWMQHSENKKIIPCSYNDYIKISKNEIPDRWLKAFTDL